MPSPDDVLKEQIASLSDCIQAGPPYCQGTVSVPVSKLDLYYGKGENAHHVNLSTATPTQLQLLAETCQPATFGVNQKDVFDETYRKAGKLDNDEFMIRFDPLHSGILDAVHSELAIDRLNKEDAIRAELYKLNVYGAGSFFKSHVDTPRSELQFGSLVITFPTAHEGGALKIRNTKDPNDDSDVAEENIEWTFDSSALLSACTEPSIAYVAFFSDIEHEVLPVVSGYRVTITYNLYWASHSETPGIPASVPHPISTTEDTLRTTLQGLLDDPTFLPDGGHLMFGLAHKYPLAPHNKHEEAKRALRQVGSRLKANDAVIYKVMQEFSLPTSLKIIYAVDSGRYSAKPAQVACNRVVPLDSYGQIEKPVWEFLRNTYGGILLSQPPPPYSRKYGPPIAINVQWVTGVPKFALQKTTFIAYGNQACLDVAYWRVYLMVRLGPFGDRTGKPRRVEKEGEDN